MSLKALQSEERQAFESRLERVGWVLLILFILAGFLGLLGTGPLGSQVATSPQGTVAVDYNRVIHHEADTSVSLTLRSDTDGTVRVNLTGPWVSGVDLQSISPEPSAQTGLPDGVAFDVDVENGGTELSLSFRAKTHGPLDLDVEMGGDSVRISQFVLP